MEQLSSIFFFFTQKSLFRKNCIDHIVFTEHHFLIKDNIALCLFDISLPLFVACGGKAAELMLHIVAFAVDNFNGFA